MYVSVCRGSSRGKGRRPAVGVESDGSLMLNVQELYTLKQQNLPIRLFIMNNDGYASIRNTQRNYFDSRFIATGDESHLAMPDWVALCEAIGLPVLRISEASELDAGLRKALGHPGPLLVDVQLVKDETLWPKVSALPQDDGSMLSMPLEDMSPLLSLEQLQEEMTLPLHPASLSARGNE